MSAVPSAPSGPFEQAPLSRAQVLVLCLAVMLAALDGFDVLATAFVAPALSLAWSVDKTALGVLLSSGLAGMAGGSLLLSPLADVFGRRPVVFVGLILMTLGSLLSAFCTQIPELAACRVITGLGIGVMVPLTLSIAAEFSNGRRRPFAVAVTSVGFTVGSMIGGLVAAGLLKHFSWPSVFMSGAVAGVIFIPLVILFLPESPAFLLNRRPPNALEKLNRVLARLKHPELAALPVVTLRGKPSYRSLFAPELIGTTVLLSLVFMLISTSVYFLLSWLPQLIADSGFPPETGSRVSAITSLVGIVSALLLGLIANRVGPRLMAGIGMIGFGISLGIFGFMPPVLALLLLSASACGFFLSGTTGVFYATLAASFPPLSRVTGIGFVIGVGRVSSIVGPALAGWMFTKGLSRSEVVLFFSAAPILAGAVLLTFFARVTRSAAVTGATAQRTCTEPGIAKPGI